jgi:hypothetical protein
MGDLVILNGTLENQFVKKLFLPYTVLEFIFYAEKISSSKSNSSRILIVIVESEQPSLEVSFPETALIRKVNVNDKL